MSADTERLIFLLEANTKSLEANLLKAEKVAARRMAAMESRALLMEKRLSASMAQGGASVMRAISQTAVAAVIAKTGSELANLSDAYTSAFNQAKIYSENTDQAKASTQFLLDTAAATRTKFEDMTAVFAGASRAGQDYGATAEQVRALTESIGTAAQLANGGPAALSGALMQLSQALPSARVEAEEFNSVIDGAYGIAKAAANGIDEAGGSVSKLQRMVRDGKVSGSQLFAALLSQLPQLREEFKKVEPTIGGAFETLRTGLIGAVQDVNEATGASQAVAKFIIDISDNVGMATSAIIIFLNEAGKLAGAAAPFAAVAASVFAVAKAGVALEGVIGALTIGPVAVGASRAAIAIGVMRGSLQALTAQSLAFIATPLGFALAAAAIATTYLAAKTMEAVKAQEEQRRRVEQTDITLGKYRDAAIAAANATGKAREEAIKLAEVQKAASEVALAAAQSQVKLAKANLLVAATAYSARLSMLNEASKPGSVIGSAGMTIGSGGGGTSSVSDAAYEAQRAKDNLRQMMLENARAQAEVARIEADIAASDKIINSGGIKVTGVPGSGKKGKKKGAGDGRGARNRAAKNAYDTETEVLQAQLEIKKLEGESTIELEKQIAIRERAAQLAVNGVPTAKNTKDAETEVNRIFDARIKKRDKEIGYVQEEINLEVAKNKEQYNTARKLEDQLAIRERIQKYVDLGLSRAQAEAQAYQDQSKIRIAETEHANEQSDKAYKLLEIESLRAEGQYDIAQQLQDEVDLAELLLSLERDNVDEAEKRARAQTELVKSTREQVRARQEESDLIDQEIELLQLRGKDRELEDKQREKRVKDRAREIAARDNISIQDATPKAQQEADAAKQAKTEGELRDTFKDAFREAVKGGDWQSVLRDKLETVFDKALNRLADAIIDIFTQQSQAGGGGSSGGWIQSILSVISGKRAGGGSVSSGKSYLVGERGPEIFTPGVGGAIAANKSLKGAGNITLVTQFVDKGQVTHEDVQRISLGTSATVTKAAMKGQAKNQDKSILYKMSRG